MGELAEKMKTWLRRPGALCLVCGVDSGPIRNFLWIFIGALVGATVFLMAWACLTKRIQERPEASALPLEAEAREREDLNA